MRRTIGTALLVAVLAAQIVLVGKAISASSDPTTLRNVLPRPTDLGQGLVLETIDPYARQVAQTWRSDAQLVSATMQIDWPDPADADPNGNLPPGGWLLLGWLSNDDLLTMRIDRGSGTIVQTTITPLSKDVAATYRSHVIDYSAATVSSGNAVQAYEVAWGKALRSACPERRPQSWISAAPSPRTGQMTWLVTYINRVDDGPPNHMTAELDWSNGQITQGAGANLPCDTGDNS